MPGSDPAEVRRQAIDLARSGRSVVQLASEFGVSQPTLYTRAPEPVPGEMMVEWVSRFSA
jgi:hypothetical protein